MTWESPVDWGLGSDHHVVGTKLELLEGAEGPHLTVLRYQPMVLIAGPDGTFAAPALVPGDHSG